MEAAGASAGGVAGWPAGGPTAEGFGVSTGCAGVTDAAVAVLELCSRFFHHHQPPMPADATNAAPIKTRRSAMNLEELPCALAWTGGAFGGWALGLGSVAAAAPRAALGGEGPSRMVVAGRRVSNVGGIGVGGDGVEDAETTGDGSAVAASAELTGGIATKETGPV
jgi:hypothetical protein